MYLDKLVSIASPLVASPLEVSDKLLNWKDNGARFGELVTLLSMRNGFYAFESALHVFPWTIVTDRGDIIGLNDWNAPNAWRKWYDGLLDGIYFFAEDIFGVQFGIVGNDIVTFDPEVGGVDLLASSLEDWAGKILSDYAQLTGHPVAHAWQIANGPIPPGKRLLPKIPFILGGSFDEKNLFAVDAMKGMSYRGELWRQLRDLPDGAQVRLRPLPLQ